MSSDDTISTSPEMHAEARRAAAESNFPKAAYDTKKVAKEEFDRIVDARYASKTFEEIWASLVAPVQKVPSMDQFFGVLTEAEYRQTISGIWHTLQAFFLTSRSQEEEERGGIIGKAVMYAVQDRLNLKGKGDLMPDVLHGIIRSPASGAAGIRRCLLHPDGCPDQMPDHTAVPVSASANLGAEILRLLRERTGK